LEFVGDFRVVLGIFAANNVSKVRTFANFISENAWINDDRMLLYLARIQGS